MGTSYLLPLASYLCTSPILLAWRRGLSLPATLLQRHCCAEHQLTNGVPPCRRAISKIKMTYQKCRFYFYILYILYNIYNI